MARWFSKVAVNITTNVTAKIDDNEIFVPHNERNQDLCLWERRWTWKVLAALPLVTNLDDWKQSSLILLLVAYIPPTLDKGNQTIEIFYKRPLRDASEDLGCIRTKYKTTIAAATRNIMVL